MRRHSAIPPPADLCDVGNIPTTLTQQFVAIHLKQFYVVDKELSTILSIYLFCLVFRRDLGVI
jgi:hypothetical protein